MQRKIIIGYDPRHNGADALGLGRSLAELRAATPIVVSALPWPSYLMGLGRALTTIGVAARSSARLRPRPRASAPLWRGS